LAKHFHLSRSIHSLSQFGISWSIERPVKHVDCDFGHERKHFRRFHSGEVGIC
jgi:hypothetical protein